VAHAQLRDYQETQVLFYQAAFWLGDPQRTLVSGIVPPQVQGFTLPLGDIREALVRLFLQPVEVTLDGSTTLAHISHSSQFGVTSKLAEDELYSIIQTINKDVEQIGPSVEP